MLLDFSLLEYLLSVNSNVNDKSFVLLFHTHFISLDPNTHYISFIDYRHYKAKVST